MAARPAAASLKSSAGGGPTEVLPGSRSVLEHVEYRVLIHLRTTYRLSNAIGDAAKVTRADECCSLRSKARTVLLLVDLIRRGLRRNNLAS